MGSPNCARWLGTTGSTSLVTIWMSMGEDQLHGNGSDGYGNREYPRQSYRLPFPWNASEKSTAGKFPRGALVLFLVVWMDNKGWQTTAVVVTHHAFPIPQEYLPRVSKGVLLCDRVRHNDLCCTCTHDHIGCHTPYRWKLLGKLKFALVASNLAIIAMFCSRST